MRYVVTIAFTDQVRVTLVSGIIFASSPQEALGMQMQKCETNHKKELEGKLMSTYTVVPIP